MKRRDMLQGLGTGIVGLSALGIKACRGTDGVAATSILGEGTGSCVLITEETAGPFPLNLSGNEAYFRTNIAEGRPGLPLDLSLKVTNANNGCAPISNARVDVWHCDRDGVYSGFSNQPGGVDARGETFCRGILLTDDQGLVRFETIYPGWYPGRVTHIHFQVYLNNGLVATSQLAFPDATNTLIYATDAYPNGVNAGTPSNTADSLFASPADSLEYQIASTSSNATTGGYDAHLDVGVAA